MNSPATERGREGRAFPAFSFEGEEQALRHPESDRTGRRGVAVGLSGGVDSAVAALLLRDQGFEVVAVTLQMQSGQIRAQATSGRDADDAERARRVATHLGIPHVLVPIGDLFEAQVVDCFVQDYARGRTPNPCVRCNARVKLPALRACARRLGLRHVATGHYARLTGDPPALTRGVDRERDQSYVLAAVPPKVFANVMLPLGGMTKREVRRLAAEAGLEGRVGPDSQDICFIPGRRHRGFLAGRLGERPGAIVDTTGRQVGRHSGTYNYTVGQRTGLGIAAPEPRYVVALDAGRQRVVVGGRSDLAVGRLHIAHVVVHAAAHGPDLLVQVRSCSAPVPARLAGARTIILREPALAVAPGQTAVLYEGDRVISAGTIVSTAPWGVDGTAFSADGTE